MTPAQLRYRAYLRSPHWQALRARIEARAGEHCERCGRFCGRNPHPEIDGCCDSSTDAGKRECEWCREYYDDYGDPTDTERQTLEVHHLTYERRGRERDDDVIALCWGCHEGITEVDLTYRRQRAAAKDED